VQILGWMIVTLFDCQPQPQINTDEDEEFPTDEHRLPRMNTDEHGLKVARLMAAPMK